MTVRTVRAVVEITFEDQVYTGPVFHTKPQALKTIDVKEALKLLNMDLEMYREDSPISNIRLIKES